jgi:glucose/arabinose dehydrogenase
MRWYVLVILAACGSKNAATDAPPTGGDGPAKDASSDGGDGSMPDADPACLMPGTIPAIKGVTVTTDALTQPLFVAQPQGSTDLYVVEKPGKIVIVRNGHVLPTPFLDITSEVNIPASDSESGLLGLEFAPDYASSGKLYIFAGLLVTTASSPGAAIVEYTRNPTNHDVVDVASRRELFSWHQDGFNSLGGTLAFGPDGALWFGTGDAERTPSDSPDLSSPLGKMFRIDATTGDAAPNNLTGKIWDYGLRNPYRWSFDRATHDLYIGDAGDQLFDEVDIEAPSTGHFDYGWDRYEGLVCHDGTMSCGTQGEKPKFVLAHGAGFSVLIGGAVYRGSAMPCLRGRYLYGWFGLGQIKSFVWNGAAITSEVDLTDSFTQTLTNVTSISQDAAGELYITTLDGGLFAIVPG